MKLTTQQKHSLYEQVYIAAVQGWLANKYAAGSITDTSNKAHDIASMIAKLAVKDAETRTL